MSTKPQSAAERTRWSALGRAPRILLCGVFGPYGVDDLYGRSENNMELYHNQGVRVSP